MAKLSTKYIAGAIFESLKNKSGAELATATTHVLDFLKKNNLFSKAPEILKYLEKIHDKDSNTVRAKILTKTPLSKSLTEHLETALKKRYKAKEVILEPIEDQTLLGGVRIESNDEVIDLSLKNKVHQLQEYLMTN